MRFARLLPVQLSLVLLAVLQGCSSAEVKEGDPEALYKDAESDIKSDHYQIAIDKLRQVKNKFPYSKYAVDAQLRIGDVYYLQELYAEAASAYETFRDLHPKHEKTPYAMFRIGKSWHEDIPSTVARDLASAQKALEAFEDFVRRYPNAPEAEEARKLIVDTRKTLADKELYIANFYYKQGELTSAKGRYAKLLALYPETNAGKTAKERLAAMGNVPDRKNPEGAPKE